MNNIQKLRKGKGWSMAKLAKESKVAKATIWRLETKDNVDVKVETLQKIAKALDSELSDIFLT